jgi:hypothetical protein
MKTDDVSQAKGKDWREKGEIYGGYEFCWVSQLLTGLDEGGGIHPQNPTRKNAPRESLPPPLHFDMRNV